MKIAVLGGDIRCYLTRALGSERCVAAEIIERNMREGHIGMKTGRGFFEYDQLDLDRHRLDRLGALASLSRGLGLARPPVLRPRCCDA